MSNMPAAALLRRRVILRPNAFAELVLWRLDGPVPGSLHRYKYRLAYVVRGKCVLRFDNELGKGDHRHIGSQENAYAFIGPDELLADFWRDVQRWNDENTDA